MFRIYLLNTNISQKQKFVHVLKVFSALEQTEGPEVEVQIQKMHQFFNYIFFPDVERKLKAGHIKKET